MLFILRDKMLSHNKRILHYLSKNSLNNIKCLTTQPQNILLPKRQHFGEVDVETLTGTDEGIVIFGLNRPKLRNALGKTLVNSLMDTTDYLKSIQNIRVVILRSFVPGVFCAGADLKERALMTNDEVKVFVKGLRQMMINIENLPMPTIAAIDGHALGGGTEIALACDLRVASSNARLGLVETSLGLIPGAGGTQRLPRIIGKSLAKELIFTSAILDGAKAKDLGLVNYSVSQNESSDAGYQKALEVARIIVQNAPIALRLAKKAVDEGLKYPLSEGYKVEQSCYEEIVETKDRLEGLLAFKEKRKPVYKGE